MVPAGAAVAYGRRMRPPQCWPKVGAARSIRSQQNPVPALPWMPVSVGRASDSRSVGSGLLVRVGVRESVPISGAYRSLLPRG